MRMRDFVHLGYMDLFGRGHKLMTLLTMLALCLLVVCITVGWGFFCGQKTALLNVLNSFEARAFGITCLETDQDTINSGHVGTISELNTSAGAPIFPDKAGGIYRWNRARHMFWRGNVEEKLRQAGATASGRTAQPDDPWLAKIKVAGDVIPGFTSSDAEEIIVTKQLLEKFCEVPTDSDRVFLSLKSTKVELTVVGVAENPGHLDGNLFILPDGLQQQFVSGTYDPQRLVDSVWISPLGIDPNATLREFELAFEKAGMPPDELVVDNGSLRCVFPAHKPWTWIRSRVRGVAADVKESLNLARGFIVRPPRERMEDAKTSNGNRKETESGRYSDATCYLGSVFDIEEARRGIATTGLRDVEQQKEQEVKRYRQIIEPLNIVLTLGLAFVIVFITGTLVALLSQRIMQRQAEIGILKANGMRPSTIRLLYATESGFMALVIGGIGVVSGWGCGLWLCSFIEGVPLLKVTLFTLGYDYVLALPLCIGGFSIAAAYFVSSRMANMQAADAVR